MDRTHSTRGGAAAPVAADDDGVRLDRWFRRHYPALNHGQLEKLLRTGQVRLDVNYIESQSLGGDLKILVKTPKAVVFGSGAY